MGKEETILKLIKEENPANPLDYVHKIVKPMMRERIDSIMSQTHEVIASKDGIRSITKGDVRASVLIITEHIQPEQLGKESIVYPLEGTEDELLMEQIIHKYNVNKSHLFWIDAVNALPYGEINGEIVYRAPNTQEIEYCRPFVENTIEMLKPKIIILLGNIPLNMFKKAPIKKEHGNWLDIKGIPAMPMYSPSFILTMEKIRPKEEVDSYRHDLMEDFKKAMLYMQNNFKANVLLKEIVE